MLPAASSTTALGPGKSSEVAILDGTAPPALVLMILLWAFDCMGDSSAIPTNRPAQPAKKYELALRRQAEIESELAMKDMAPPPTGNLLGLELDATFGGILNQQFREFYPYLSLAEQWTLVSTALSPQLWDVRTSVRYGALPVSWLWVRTNSMVLHFSRFGSSQPNSPRPRTNAR